MESKSKSRITIMREVFALGCKDLGLSQQTCLNLTLLLSSLEEIETMVWSMREAEDRGIRLTRTQVVRMAEYIKEIYLEQQVEEKSHSDVVAAIEQF